MQGRSSAGKKNELPGPGTLSIGPKTSGTARDYSAARTGGLTEGDPIQAPIARSARLHQEYDRIPVPEDVPEIGVRAGEEGVIRRLTYLRNSVFAFVMVTYSTGQPKGWVVVEVKPEQKVRSYAAAS